jgi:hypothetical protein
MMVDSIGQQQFVDSIGQQQFVDFDLIHHTLVQCY